MSKVKKVTTIAPVVYSTLQNPKSRAAVMNGLQKVTDKLEVMSANHKDPLVGSVTGKPVNTANMNKLDKVALKLPKNSFDVLHKTAVKGREALAKYDEKLKSQGR